MWKLHHHQPAGSLRQPAGHLHGDTLGWWKFLARTQGPLAGALILNLASVTILLWVGWVVARGLQ
ncbi:hypothetical protein [Methylobacterium planeticum]|uniref:Uncharacterized protein n=1 Tax=Methylobacterium planeticum TaxID=2615211 RepID=A0A6N6MYB4_9HYPH|nr:hypothetical protein [Methylobacterium planeticum]KAB1074322.1 hypothetical protein F6X51_08060 [Methylobacterium planeticum]